MFFDIYIKLYKSKLLPENTQFTVLISGYSQMDEIQHSSCMGGEDLIDSTGGGQLLQFGGLYMEFTYQDSKLQMLIYNLAMSTK